MSTNEILGLVGAVLIGVLIFYAAYRINKTNYSSIQK